MTLPRDVARCHGHYFGKTPKGRPVFPDWQCRQCLRWNSPAPFISFMEPPALDPDGSCPYRIPPP